MKWGTYIGKISLAGLLSIGLTSNPGLSHAQSSIPADIQGHWAEKQIQSWVEQGMARGYEDGTFKPDGEITRAEFIALVNRSFGFSKQAELRFTDVPSGEWYAEEIAKGAAAGYISGYEDGTMKPNNPVSRQEVAKMIGQLTGLAGDSSALAQFHDAHDIPVWSREHIAAVVKKGYMTGYPDKTFQSKRFITRAEAIATLDRVKADSNQSVSFDQPGVYGPSEGVNTVEGDAVVLVGGVTLQNTVIKGNLVLAEGIGEGDVHLNQVEVQGTVTVKGGGANSIYMKDSSLHDVTVDKKGGSIRLVASGKTNVHELKLDSGAKLEESNLSGSGFTHVTVSSAVSSQAAIILYGEFSRLDVKAVDTVLQFTGGKIQELVIGAKTAVEVMAGTIEQFKVAETAAETAIKTASEAKITLLTLDAATKVTGDGKIETAKVNAEGSSFEKAPEKMEFAPHVSAPKTPVGGGGGAVPGAGVTPAVTNISIAGVTFTQSGNTFTANLPKESKILHLTGDFNTDTRVEIVSILDGSGKSVFGDLNAKSEAIPAGNGRTVNLIDMLGLSSLDQGSDGIAGSTLSRLINGENTGTMTFEIKLTNSSGSASATYRIHVNVQ